MRKLHPLYKLRNRAYNLKKAYDITLVEYDELFKTQLGLCKSCGRPQSSTHKRTVKLVVDHCHKTGKVRGLLCSGCNSALGHLHDDLTKAKLLVQYILSSVI